MTPASRAPAVALAAHASASSGSPRPAASSARQRSNIGGTSRSHVGRLGPLVEQPLGRVPGAGAQLALAQVQPLECVGDGLAALVGERERRLSSACAASISPRQTSCWAATRSGDSAR